MKLLAISLPRHDTNFTYFDGENLHYHKLERTKQIKRYHTYDNFSWKYEVESLWGVDVDNLDAIVFQFEEYQYYRSTPEKIKEVIDGKTNFTQLTDDINPFKDVTTNKNIWYVSHHYSHYLSAWMLCDALPKIGIVVDGEGDSRTWSIFRDNKLIDYGHKSDGSFGGGMWFAGEYLGVTATHTGDIAGKVMGLQSYGNLDKEYLNILRQYNFRRIGKIYDVENYFQHKKDVLIGRLTPLDWIKTVHTRVAEVLIELFDMYSNENEPIVYSGGVAQNVIWNTKIKNKYDNIIIPPHSGDEGLSLGAIEWLRQHYALPKFKFNNFPYAQTDIAPKEKVQMETIKRVAKLLAEGKIVGWYQGNGEIGPRALGNRSILFNPLIPDGRQIINLIKNRENYRPFGASILKEYKQEYFDSSFDDDYMLYASQIKTNALSSITHVDGSCRVQTVSKDSDFRKLLEEFNKITGCPILLNTSLNIAGKPLAGHPEAAKQLFLTTPINCMVIGNEVTIK